MATCAAKTAGKKQPSGVHGAPGIVLFARADQSVEPLLKTGACACAVLNLGGISGEDASELIAVYRAASTDAATALLSLSDPDMAKTLSLDGVHLTDPAHSVSTARERLGRSANIGAGPAHDRHTAMLLGEQEPDYVLLASSNGSAWAAPDPELVTWWAELFEVPSVAFAAETGQALELAAAGADFVALGESFCGRADASEQVTALASELAEFTTAEAAVR